MDPEIIEALKRAMKEVLDEGKPKTSDYLSAEKVFRSNRSVRAFIGSIGAGGGAYVGYVAGAATAGLSAVPMAVFGALVYGLAAYGSATLGTEIRTHMEAAGVMERVKARFSKPELKIVGA